MQWSEIRRHYPEEWLLIEAIEARSEAGQRILDEIAVVASFPDSIAAMKRYAHLHHEAPQRELYVCHTERERLEIRERRWLGIRCA
jgi:hypothetical protein